MHDAIRQNSTLSPAQDRIIAALAAGESITEVARRWNAPLRHS
jgi:hypothetical protein